MKPILSVVIPTYKRPQLLPRAITSALGAAPDGDVEVLVVPNGQDDSWKQTALAFATDRRVTWHPLSRANACASRNLGLSLASGKYVRFLDDDDYLLPQAAKQLELHEASGVQITSGPQENISATGANLGITHLPDTDDFVAAAFRSTAISLTQGSVFLKSALADCWWPEDAARYHDYLWSIGLAQRDERSWIRLDEPVAAYCQHYNPRLSRIMIGRESSALVVGAILDLHSALKESARNTPLRDAAAATALLSHAHTAFSGCPVYLSRAILFAYRLDRNTKPSQKLFVRHPWLGYNLLVTEWALLLPAYLYRSYRYLSWLAGRMHARIFSQE